MMAIDRLSAFRVSDQPGGVTLFEPSTVALSPRVPPVVGREKPQKTIVSPLSPVSHRFSITDLIMELMKHPDPSRADAERAADRFGLSVEIAAYYIGQEQRRRTS
jgi:hypothetical protein